MLVECNECGLEFLTEADPYVYIPKTRDFNCGCMYYPKGTTAKDKTLTLHFYKEEHRDSFLDQINSYENGGYYEIKEAPVIAHQKDLDKRYNLLALSVNTARELLKIMDITQISGKDEKAVHSWLERFYELDKRTGVTNTVTYLRMIAREKI